MNYTTDDEWARRTLRKMLWDCFMVLSSEFMRQALSMREARPRLPRPRR